MKLKRSEAGVEERRMGYVHSAVTATVECPVVKGASRAGGLRV